MKMIDGGQIQRIFLTISNLKNESKELCQSRQFLVFASVDVANLGEPRTSGVCFPTSISLHTYLH